MQTVTMIALKIPEFCCLYPSTGRRICIYISSAGARANVEVTCGLCTGRYVNHCELCTGEGRQSAQPFSVAKVFVTMRPVSAVGMRKFWTDEKEP